MIKAIETVYNGYRFRSRLEARWAVFFDTLGVKYEYEKEGYELPDGAYYLPDFWLPEIKRWVEIKGNNPTWDEQKNTREIFRGTGFPSCIFYGLPGENEAPADFACLHNNNGGHSFELVQWIECLKCGIVDIGIHLHGDCSIYNEHTGEFLNACNCNYIHFYPNPNCANGCPFISSPDGGCNVQCQTSDSGYNSPRLIAAYTAARQARFEYGERGR